MEYRERVAAIFMILAALNVSAWIALFALSSKYSLFLSLGTLAYLLGLRHALDADHIAAIDNATRKLAQNGGRPAGTGLFFSLGHSTVVVLLSIAIVVAGAYATSTIPSVRAIGSIAGTGVSALFLYAIGAFNLLILIDIYKAARASKSESWDIAKMDDMLAKRGFMNRILGSRLDFISKSWHMYPVGFLFGLGFDTASEIGLLAITAGAASAIPTAYVLVLPVLFTAGMTLLDTLDGMLMLSAYSWSMKNPASKVYYNLLLTGASVVVAFVIGSIELSNLIGAEAAGWFGSLSLGASRLPSLPALLVAFAATVCVAAAYLVLHLRKPRRDGRLRAKHI
jgi:high-affinity nickel-transport protein